MINPAGFLDRRIARRIGQTVAPRLRERRARGPAPVEQRPKVISCARSTPIHQRRPVRRPQGARRQSPLPQDIEHVIAYRGRPVPLTLHSGCHGPNGQACLCRKHSANCVQNSEWRCRDARAGGHALQSRRLTSFDRRGFPMPVVGQIPA